MSRRATPASSTSIGLLLQLKRVKRRLQQNEVATRAGLSRERLSRIEAGRIDPRWSDVEKITDALGIKVPELFEESSIGTR